MPNIKQKAILHAPKDFVQELYQLLLKNKKLLVTGLGVFYIRKLPKRSYVHPITKKQIISKATQTVGLHVSSSLKSYVQ